MRAIYGVRHGEVHNPQGVLYGHLPGYRLSDRGEQEAAAVANVLGDAPLVAVYSSPLERAVQTAEAIATAAGLEVVVDERLFEWRFWSPWAGRTWDEIKAEASGEWHAYEHDPAALAGDEPLLVCGERIVAWLDDVKARHDDGIIVGVSHLDPLRAALLHLTRRAPTDLWSIQIGHAMAVRLDPDPDAQPLAPAALRGVLQTV